MINLDDKNSKGTHWVSLFIDRDAGPYFDSFGMEHISLEVLNKISDESTAHNIFRKEDNEWMNYVWIFLYRSYRIYACRKNFVRLYTNLFSPNDCKKNSKIIYKYFDDRYVRRSKSWVYIKNNWWNKKLCSSLNKK